MKEFWEYFKKNVKNMVIDLKSNDKEKKKKQIPNLLTLTRGVFAPITIIPAVANRHIYIAFVLIAICSLTDAFDGWYARKYNAQSEFGALLDAICDKLFVLTLAFPLVFVYPKWILVILILEFIIAIINVYSKLRGNDAHSSITGKIKTVILDISIALCYLDFIINVSEMLMGILSVFTNILQLFSIYGYYKIYKKQSAEQKMRHN